MRNGRDRGAAPDPARWRIAHPRLAVALAQIAGLHAAKRVRVIVVERAGRRRRLVGQAELLQPWQELLQMLAAEMPEHVVARRLLAAPRDEAQHQRGHQRIVERADGAIGRQRRWRGHQPEWPSTAMARDFPAFSRIARTGLYSGE